MRLCHVPYTADGTDHKIPSQQKVNFELIVIFTKFINIWVFMKLVLLSTYEYVLSIYERLCFCEYPI